MRRIIFIICLAMSSNVLFSAPADLDTSFDGDGVDFISIGSTEEFTSVAIDSNDKIVAIGRSGNEVFIARYNEADGTYDTSFANPTGYANFTNIIDAMVYGTIDSSNNIFVVGDAHGDSTKVRVAKIKSDGSGLDTSFNNPNGYLDIEVDASATAVFVRSIMLDSSDRPVVVGDYTNAAGTRVPMVCRVLANGSSLDTSFNGTGLIKETAFPGGTNHAIWWDVAFDSIGRIVVSGYVYGQSGGVDTIVARYTDTGTVESGFGNQNSIVGTGGIVVHALSDATSWDSGTSVDIAPGNKIVISGTLVESAVVKSYVAKLNEFDGYLDSSFGTSGKTTFSVNSNYMVPRGITIDALGRIIVVGADNTDGQEAIVRLTKDGSLDSTFGSSGITFDFKSGYALGLRDVILQKDGKIVFVGDVNNKNQTVVGRLEGNSPVGNVDLDFGNRGELTLNGTASLGTGDAKSMHILSNGKILLAVQNSDGTTTDLVKLNTNHTADGLFNGGNRVQFATSADLQFMDTDAVGNILLCGGDGTSGSDAAWLHKVQSDGSAHATFVSPTDVIDIAYKVVEQSSGRLIVAGLEDGVATLIAYSPVTGDVDTSFGTNGRYTVAGISSPIVDIAVDAATDQLLIAYMDGSSHAQVRKLMPNAKAEVAGFSFGTPIGLAAEVDQIKMRILNSGKIAVVIRDGQSFKMSRYFATGGTDVAEVTVNSTDLDNLRDVIALSDEKMIIIGEDSSNELVMVRMDSSLALDTTFSPSTGLSSTEFTSMVDFKTVDIQSDGNILVAGSSS